MGKRIDKINEVLRSDRGKNMMIFFAFLILSTVLWLVQALNEETQRELRCTLRVTNVPDSLVRLSPVPESVNVSVRAKGTVLLKYWLRPDPELNIDYRIYRTGEKIQFSDAAMRAFLRNNLGGTTQILSVTPDSLLVDFTSQPGAIIPLSVDANIGLAPQYVLDGKPHASVDSVTIYSKSGIPSTLKSVSTTPITLNNLKSSQTVKVAVKVPAGMRSIPDSVMVTIGVEPLISKTRQVQVTAINVPSGMRLVTMPSHVEVYYMVPMSIYKQADSNPKFVVEADYIHNHNGKLPIRLSQKPKDFTNAFLSTDSVGFILEMK